MMIPDEVKSLFEKQPLVAFGTADKEGNPNVVPVFWKTTAGGETILLLDNYMKTSKKNLLENSRVCVSFWDPATEEAYKIKGEAAYHTSGDVFEQGKAFMQSKKPGRVPAGVVGIAVKEIYAIKPGPQAGERL